jgi:predicted transcriptional regulator
MSNKKISIGIKGADESALEFVNAWRRAERKQPAEEPADRLYFQDLATLLQVLTPRRQLRILDLFHRLDYDSDYDYKEQRNRR